MSDPHLEADLSTRHPSTRELASYFAKIPVPDPRRLDSIRRQCATLATLMILELGDGPELSAGLRKLLEAKDCFVRAALK